MPEDTTYEDTTYEITLTILADEPMPTEAEIRRALYQGLTHIDAEDAIHVERF